MEKSWFNTEKFLNQRTQQHLSEEKEISEVLKKSSAIDTTDVRVHSSQGIITLEGKVASTQAMAAIIDMVEKIPGVGNVVNNLELSDRESHPDQ